jgi:hypothetical protein
LSRPPEAARTEFTDAPSTASSQIDLQILAGRARSRCHPSGCAIMREAQFRRDHSPVITAGNGGKADHCRRSHSGSRWRIAILEAKHARCLKILDLDPGVARARLIVACAVFRDDALQAHGTGVSEHLRASPPVPSLHPIRNRGPCSWAVSLIRKRAEYLGAVVAPNREAAEAAAVEWFSLDSWQRKRLVLTEIR